MGAKEPTTQALRGRHIQFLRCVAEQKDNLAPFIVPSMQVDRVQNLAEHLSELCLRILSNTNHHLLNLTKATHPFVCFISRWRHHLLSSV